MIPPRLEYRNLLWLRAADWNFRHDGNFSASRGLPSDAEQLTLVTEFSIFTSLPIWILFRAYISFDNCT